MIAGNLDKSPTNSAPRRTRCCGTIADSRVNNAIQCPGAIVFSTPVEVSATARALWLAELAGALDQARDVVDRLKIIGHHSSTVVELQIGILAAQAAVESLRMGREAREQLGPRWTNLVLWENSRSTGF